jgi:hypothetical protein
MSDRSLMRQCGNCSTLFLEFDEVAVAGKVYEICPNPNCHGPSNICSTIPEAAVSWQFMHIIAHSGISERRRTTLRNLAESSMGPWEFEYRSL